MKLLILADIHGQLITLNTILKHVENETFGLCIIAGDITNFGNIDEFSAILKKIACQIDSPIYYIQGNCDSPIKKKLNIDNTYWIEKTPVDLEQFSIVGTKLNVPNFLSSIAEKYMSKNVPLCLVTHFPPYGTTIDKEGFYRHKGSRSIKNFLIRYPNIFLHVCGHAHKAQGFIEINNAIAVNPGSVTLGNY
ncbi:MAG: metallophosphoesterase family protein, partial [Candidatus Heimdallarchaeaceae archaeon]